MDIGNKLKSARTASGMTQETVAEKAGVSRQTVSNWENNKSYPDIVSVIKLSDLYSLSLDELLKGDEKMIKHLDESTNKVKSRQRFSKLIIILSYVVIWALSIIAFWGGGKADAAVYSLAVFLLVLPVTTFVLSVTIGKDPQWGKYRWLMLLFFGIMFMLADYATFSLANMAAFSKFNSLDFENIVPGIIVSAVGFFIGLIISAIKKRKSV